MEVKVHFRAAMNLFLLEVEQVCAKAATDISGRLLGG